MIDVRLCFLSGPSTTLMLMMVLTVDEFVSVFADHRRRRRLLHQQSVAHRRRRITFERNVVVVTVVLMMLVVGQPFVFTELGPSILKPNLPKSIELLPRLTDGSTVGPYGNYIG